MKLKVSNPHFEPNPFLYFQYFEGIMHTSYSKENIITKVNERQYNSYLETNATYGLPFCLDLKVILH